MKPLFPILRPWLLVAALAAAALLPGCALLNEPVPAHPVASTSPLSPVERNFLAAVAARSMYEIEVSRLAARRALDPRVRSYAEAMVRQQEEGNAELVALMSAKGVAPPKGLTARSADKLHRLAALPPSADFDRGYVRVVGVEDHTRNIAQLERLRRDARDRDLRAWIDRSLPLMRRNLTAARALAETIAA